MSVDWSHRPIHTKQAMLVPHMSKNTGVFAGNLVRLQWNQNDKFHKSCCGV